MPVPTGSIASPNTIGMTDVACFAARTALRSRGDNDFDLEADKLGRDLGKALGASFRPAILDRHGAILDPAELMQSLGKSGDQFAFRRTRAQARESDGPQLARLLRARRGRPCRRTTEHGEKLAPL